MTKWNAHIEYDQGRLGHCAIFGAASREDAIDWLSKAFVWKLCWYMKPSMWIEPTTSRNE